MLLSWDEIRKVILKAKGHVLLYGPAGTGKTYLAKLVAKAVERSYYPVTFSADLSAQEVIGHFVPKGGEFVWHYGPALLAWQTGGIFNPNEINECSGAVQIAMHSILDDPEMAKLCLPSGEVVHPRPGFRCIATMNGEPSDLPLPLLNRFSLKIKITEPSAEALARIRDKVIRQAVERAYTDGQERITFRDMLAVDTLIKDGLDTELAYKAVFSDDWQDVHGVIELSRTAPEKKE